jgi:protein phosphatase PTC7
MGSVTALSATKPLATEGDWTAYLDEEGTGLVYYFNGKTGESLWEPPTSTFPDVALTGSLQRKARRKREQYIRAVEQQKKREKKRGFLSTLLEEPEAVVEQKSADAEKQNDWFKSLAKDVIRKEDKKETADFFDKMFSGKEERKKEEPETKKEPSKEQMKGDFFDRMFSTATATITKEPAVVERRVEEKPSEIVAPEEVKPIQIDMAAHVLPHPAKKSWGGEDAVFTRGRTFGVFDGVSGAEKLDGIPLYSKTLADQMKSSVGDGGLSIQELQKRLREASDIANQIATGASTAIVASITEDGFLRALNLGDSACIVIRDGKIVGRTREISHYWECPYQLSTDSPDKPRDGTKLNIELQKGDLILMGSDGIFDNLRDAAVVDTVASDNSPQQVAMKAKCITELSRKVSLDRTAETPYAELAKKYGDPDYSDARGGKVDDVSCIVVKYG